VALTGVSASGAVGLITPVYEINGNQATGFIGTVGSTVTLALTGVSASGSTGTVTGEAIYEQALTGVSSAGAVGTISVGERLVAITGSQAMGNVGNVGVFYWSLIDDSENANWSLIDDTADANWQNITTV
jgi:hypothetical protein